MTDLAQLRLRVASGDEHARVLLARQLLATPGKQEEAQKQLQIGGARGFPAALRLQATLAVRGLGRERNFEEALDLVSRAAAGGDVEAQGQLRAVGGKFDRDAWLAPVELRQHHAAPRIFTIEKFIPREVCAWFIAFARRRQEMSMVRDGATGRDVLSAGRSASLAGTDALEGDLLLQLTKLRIADAIGTDVAHQEPTQFLRYGPGQEYQAHYDLIRPQEEAAAAEELRVMGQRVATVLVYLNDDYKGGETHFPHLNWGFRGKPGDALVFWNMSAAGERERASLHAGLPVKSGTKWILSQWVRAKPVPLI